jgi:excisionase family DNA binding protein
MATAHPKPSTPPRRRRPVAWPNLHIDHSEPSLRAPGLSEWPQIPIHVPTPANDDRPHTGTLVSLADLAERLGVCTATIKREVRRGRLDSCKVGWLWRFTEQQIADYLKLSDKPLRLYGKPLNDNDRHDAS